MASKRILKELKDLQKDPPTSCSDAAVFGWSTPARPQQCDPFALSGFAALSSAGCPNGPRPQRMMKEGEANVQLLQRSTTEVDKRSVVGMQIGEILEVMREGSNGVGVRNVITKEDHVAMRSLSVQSEGAGNAGLLREFPSLGEVYGGRESGHQTDKRTVGRMVHGSLSGLSGAEYDRPCAGEGIVGMDKSDNQVVRPGMRGNHSFLRVMTHGKGTVDSEGALGRQLPMKRLKVSKNNRGRIILPNSLAEKGAARWKNTLIGVVLGRKIPLSVIDKNVRRMWSRWGVMEVGFAGAGLIFVRFQDDRGFEEILRKGDWSIVGCPFLVRRWTVGLTYDSLEPASLPLWIILKNVPLEFCYNEGIQYVVSGVGTPLKIDFSSLSRDVVRVLVEFEVAIPLKRILQFCNEEDKDIDITIDYEFLPLQCDECVVFGHDKLRCPKRKTEGAIGGQPRHEPVKWIAAARKGVVHAGGALRKPMREVEPVQGEEDDIEVVKSTFPGEDERQKTCEFPIIANQFKCLEDDDEVAKSVTGQSSSSRRKGDCLAGREDVAIVEVQPHSGTSKPEGEKMVKAGKVEKRSRVSTSSVEVSGSRVDDLLQNAQRLPAHTMALPTGTEINQVQLQDCSQLGIGLCIEVAEASIENQSGNGGSGDRPLPLADGLQEVEQSPSLTALELHPYGFGVEWADPLDHKDLFMEHMALYDTNDGLEEVSIQSVAGGGAEEETDSDYEQSYRLGSAGQADVGSLISPPRTRSRAKEKVVRGGYSKKQGRKSRKDFQ